ncbi:4F2 cell-surface antigen heavy chain-like [Tropilaelaps mercedesae]|uniref:4F2 cell-surface antigen heavy chain-like n=1 Tax=Tropilaelaps mercedesae TaxID=418985 RepID=A0A1V9XYY0_9ACAR|nr:4F2 cell-surface antigen heavy chain-like [Tropilaelaps mercedesae]
MQEAKFSTADAQMEIDMANTGHALSISLTKEEVTTLANEPFWMALRRILFMLFWILWMAMLIGSVVIITLTPKCVKLKEPFWYESSPIYRIRVDQFADSNGDGIGDLVGIINKLGYIKDDVSMRAVTLEGLLDENDASVIRPKLGSPAEFKKLASQIKVIIRVPLGEVVNELNTPRHDLETAIINWLEAGAAGFILDEFNFESTAHRNGLPRWHTLIANLSSTETSGKILLALSTHNFQTLPDTYCRYADMVLNYDMINLTPSYDSSELYPLLADLTEKNRTYSCRDNFVLGTGEITPLGDRFQPRSRVEALLIFNMLADATPIVYYGDEFGKKDTSGEEKSGVLKHIVEAHSGIMQWHDIEHIKEHHEPNQYKLFQKLAKLRLNEASIRTGVTAVRDLDSTVLAMARIKPGNPGFVIVSNFRSQTTAVSLRTRISKQIPAQGSVVLTSTNSKKPKDARLPLEDLQVEGEETLVLQFIPEVVEEADRH